MANGSLNKDEILKIVKDYLDEAGLSSLVPTLDKEHNLLRKTHRSGIFALGDLNNVLAAAALDGDLLAWDAASGQWKPRAFSSYSIPSPFWTGFLTMSTVACPTGWSRKTAMDDRFPMGAASAGTTGGTTKHKHATVLGASWDVSSGGWDVPAAGTYDSDEKDHIPSYYTVIFCERN